jgi:plasmid stability protein
MLFRRVLREMLRSEDGISSARIAAKELGLAAGRLNLIIMTTAEKNHWRQLCQELATQQNPARRTLAAEALREVLAAEKKKQCSQKGAALLQVADVLFGFMEFDLHEEALCRSGEQNANLTGRSSASARSTPTEQPAMN